MREIISDIKRKASKPVDRLLETADLARDATRWDEARDAYAEYLKLVPNDAAIWVQYGHALKEGGNISAATDAYRESISIKPEDADAHLQLGHALKLSGDRNEAARYYRHALELDPTLLDAARELRGLGESAEIIATVIPRTQETTVARTLIDLSDLFAYLWHHDTVTGIQRVQLGVSEALLSGKISFAQPLAFLANSPDHSGYVEIDAGVIRRLIAELEQSAVSHSTLKSIVTQSAGEGLAYVAHKGDLILILGAFWVIPGITERVVQLKSEGVWVGVLVHDIIPLIRPEYCEEKTVETFTTALPVIRIADFVFTVSEHTKRELVAYLARESLPVTSIRSLKLAHITTKTRPDVWTKISDAVREIIHSKYAIYVSTLEIRKNHMFVFRAWKRLIEEREIEVPALVLVGRLGWHIDELMSQISSTDGLDGKIIVVSRVSDAELALLYENCMFSLFTSFEEGWGLPVGESLSHGRPCIASNISSVPEVGGEFVDYVNPYDLGDGCRIIKKFIADSDYREERARTIKANFRPTTWFDVADQMAKTVTQAVTDHQVTPVPSPPLESGTIYTLGHQNQPVKFALRGAGRFAYALFDTKWYPTENFGRWMAGRSAAIGFAVDEASVGNIVIYLRIITPPWIGKDNWLTLEINGVKLTKFALTGNSIKPILARGTAKNKHVNLCFNVSGRIEPVSDGRPLSVGLCALGYANEADALARIQLMEEIQDVAGLISIVK
jgi:glycosyltransferase involved in cell wall biosynthesis